MRRSSTCRLRKVACPDCGYTIRMTRSWMLRGFPKCPCGQEMTAEAPADLAYCGLIGPDDVSLADWNAICRENDWAITRNQGSASRAKNAVEIMRARAGAAHCAYPGCGRWVADGAERCTAGHAQDETIGELAALPF